jgi:hypothetical protein
MRRLHLVTPLLLGPLFGVALAVPGPQAHAQLAVGLSVTVAPPVLPIYVQPPIPTPGYIWTPGYWAWGPDGYYWVPGTWVLPPAVGLLWTPGYWGWNDGGYAWNAGYWGPTVGFYGGIDYGFGYTGFGYWGGRWDHGHFAYNRTVNNFGGAHITNVYSRAVVHNTSINRVAYNGGHGGTTARPTAQQQALAHEHHLAPTALQAQHQRMAAADPRFRDSFNHGHPAIAATSRPGAFGGRGVAAARPLTADRAEMRPAGAAARPAGREGLTTARPGAVQAGANGARPALRGPATEAHPAVDAGRAARPAYHAAAPAYHAAAPAYHAATPAYHAAAPAYHAAAPAYHAAAPAYHTAAPAYHAAAPAYHAAPRPAAPAYHAAARPSAPAPRGAPRQEENRRG